MPLSKSQIALSILGVVSLIPAALKGVVALIRLGGDADFVISVYDDPGWVGTMINVLLDPPGWSILPTIVIGLALIFISSRHSRVHPEEGGASPTSSLMKSYQDGEWEPVYPPNRRGYPDWSIRELFFHIRPDLIEDQDGMEWAEVGNDLKDKFSVGRLSVWGREKSDWVGEIMKEKPALQPISMSYWPKADFTYTFLADGKEQTDHTYAPEGCPIYRDLQVNKRDALDIWPLDKSIEIRRDVRIGEAIAYIATGAWGGEFFETAGEPDSGLNQALDDLVQAAADGEVRVWGRLARDRVLEPIPAEYWRKHGIDWFSIAKDDPKTTAKYSVYDYDKLEIFSGLMTSRVQVERKWPPKSAGH